MLRYHKFEFSMFGVNTYIVVDSDTNEGAIIDPAMNDSEENEALSQFIKSNNIRLTQIINTHLHLDHCFGLSYVKDTYGVKLKAHKDDALLGQLMDQQYQMFGMRPQGRQVTIDIELNDGDIINIGNSKLTVIHVPGHSLGGIALYDERDKLLFSGDSLFKGSIGRTDLPGGNYQQLIRSIQTKIMTLPDDVVVLPGHGPATTIGQEKSSNPYI